jgi:hypothetical protein
MIIGKKQVIYGKIIILILEKAKVKTLSMDGLH